MWLLWQTRIIFRRQHHKLAFVMTTCCNCCEGGAEICILRLKFVVQGINLFGANWNLGLVAVCSMTKYCGVMFEKFQVLGVYVARLLALWRLAFIDLHNTCEITEYQINTDTRAHVMLNHHFINTLLLLHISNLRESYSGSIMAAV